MKLLKVKVRDAFDIKLSSEMDKFLHGGKASSGTCEVYFMSTDPFNYGYNCELRSSGGNHPQKVIDDINAARQNALNLIKAAEKKFPGIKIKKNNWK